MNRIVIIVLVITLTGCFGRYARKHPEEYLTKKAFPEDIKKDGYVLLIQKQEESKIVSNVQNRRVNKLMKKYYDKPYIMVSTDELKSGKYDNKNVYRYLLRQTEIKGRQSVDNGPGNGGMTYRYRDVYIIDRLTNKDYPTAGQATSSFQGCMNMVAPYLGKMK